MIADSFCSPSRGPTSTISTWAGSGKIVSPELLIYICIQIPRSEGQAFSARPIAGRQSFGRNRRTPPSLMESVAIGVESTPDMRRHHRFRPFRVMPAEGVHQLLMLCMGLKDL